MKVHKNFPREGVDFLDINPDLNDPAKLIELRTQLIDSVVSDEFLIGSVDKVVAIEARGFLFGVDLAATLNAGLVLVRKPGKLPGETINVKYFTEYSEDELELQVASIQPGDRVLIHDDVLATGGTAAAAANLVQSLGGIVLGYSFIAEIVPINGKDKLCGASISSLLKIG